MRDAILTTWKFLSAAAPRMADEYEVAISAFALARMGKGGEDALLAKLSTSPYRQDHGEKRQCYNQVVLYINNYIIMFNLSKIIILVIVIHCIISL